MSYWCNKRWPCAFYSGRKSFYPYGIRDVPIKCSVNVTTDVTIFCKYDVIIDGTACGFSHVTRYVPKRINLGVSKLVISISQKSAPPYRVIIDLSIQYVCIVTAEGSMPMKNWMNRSKPLIFYDFRFKTQHQ